MCAQELEIDQQAMFVASKDHKRRALRAAVATAIATAVFAGTSAQAQSGDASGKDARQAETDAPAPTKPPKVNREIAEAARLLKGPAAHPECVWIGRRIVTLLWRDDLNTAALHRKLYTGFKCPPAHIQKAFRCIVRQGDLNPKASEKLNKRVHNCWVRPDFDPSSAALTKSADRAKKAKVTE